VFTLFLAEVLAQRREVVVEPRKEFLARRTRFIDDRVFPTWPSPFGQFLRRADDRRGRIQTLCTVYRSRDES